MGKLSKATGSDAKYGAPKKTDSSVSGAIIRTGGSAVKSVGGSTVEATSSSGVKTTASMEKTIVVTEKADGSQGVSIIAPITKPTSSYYVEGQGQMSEGAYKTYFMQEVAKAERERIEQVKQQSRVESTRNDYQKQQEKKQGQSLSRQDDPLQSKEEEKKPSVGYETGNESIDKKPTLYKSVSSIKEKEEPVKKESQILYEQAEKYEDYDKGKARRTRLYGFAAEAREAMPDIKRKLKSGAEGFLTLKPNIETSKQAGIAASALATKFVVGASATTIQVMDRPDVAINQFVKDAVVISKVSPPLIFQSTKEDRQAAGELISEQVGRFLDDPAQTAGEYYAVGRMVETFPLKTFEVRGSAKGIKGELNIPEIGFKKETPLAMIKKTETVTRAGEPFKVIRSETTGRITKAGEKLPDNQVVFGTRRIDLSKATPREREIGYIAETETEAKLMIKSLPKKTRNKAEVKTAMEEQGYPGIVAERQTAQDMKTVAEAIGKQKSKYKAKELFTDVEAFKAGDQKGGVTATYEWTEREGGFSYGSGAARMQKPSEIVIRDINKEPTTGKPREVHDLDKMFEGKTTEQLAPKVKELVEIQKQEYNQPFEVKEGSLLVETTRKDLPSHAIDIHAIDTTGKSGAAPRGAFMGQSVNQRRIRVAGKEIQSLSEQGIRKEASMGTLQKIKIGEKVDKLEFKGEDIGENIFYHGTSLKNAKRIIAEGLDPQKGVDMKVVFLEKDMEMGKTYTDKEWSGNKGAVLFKVGLKQEQLTNLKEMKEYGYTLEHHYSQKIPPNQLEIIEFINGKNQPKEQLIFSPAKHRGKDVMDTLYEEVPTLLESKRRTTTIRQESLTKAEEAASRLRKAAPKKVDSGMVSDVELYQNYKSPSTRMSLKNVYSVERSRPTQSPKKSAQGIIRSVRVSPTIISTKVSPSIRKQSASSISSPSVKLQASPSISSPSPSPSKPSPSSPPSISSPSPSPSKSSPSSPPSISSPSPSPSKSSPSAPPSIRYPEVNPPIKPWQRYGKQEQQRPQGFNVFTKKAGKVVKINLRPLKESEAINLGAFTVGTSARASFKVEKAREAVEQVFKGRGQLTDFYKSRGGFMVERRERRIKSPGEKREITYKGIASSRKKRGYFRW